MNHTATRLLEIDAGHRLQRHESKCRHVHGHRYGFAVTVGAEDLDACGRVVDFSVVKAKVGGWLDEHWDHGFLYEDGDPVGQLLTTSPEGMKTFVLPFPPTAENLARFVFDRAGELLAQDGVTVVQVTCYETPNCWASHPAFPLPPSGSAPRP